MIPRPGGGTSRLCVLAERDSCGRLEYIAQHPFDVDRLSLALERVRSGVDARIQGLAVAGGFGGGTRWTRLGGGDWSSLVASVQLGGTVRLRIVPTPRVGARLERRLSRGHRLFPTHVKNREVWDGLSCAESRHVLAGVSRGSLVLKQAEIGDVLARRASVDFGHVLAGAPPREPGVGTGRYRRCLGSACECRNRAGFGRRPSREGVVFDLLQESSRASRRGGRFHHVSETEASFSGRGPISRFSSKISNPIPQPILFKRAHRLAQMCPASPPTPQTQDTNRQPKPSPCSPNPRNPKNP